MVDGGKDLRLLPARAEPGRRLGARQAAAPGHGEPGLGRRARPRHDRERHVLEGRARGRDRRDRAEGAARRCSSSPPPRTSRRRGRSPKPSAWCSGGTRPASRPAISARTWFFYHGPDDQGAAGEVDGPARRAVQKLDWSYHVEEARRAGAWPEPSAEDVLRRINGYEVATGKPVNGFLELKADGSGVRLLDLLGRVRGRGEPGRAPQAARSRARTTPSGAGRGPRTAGCSTTAAPRIPREDRGARRKKLVWWDADKSEWTGRDVPDFPTTTRPATCRRRGRSPRACAATTRSSCRPTARRGCSRRTACWTGRCPRYEAHESPVRNPLYGQQCNPTGKVYGRRQPVEPEPAGAGHRRVPVRAHHRAAHRAPPAPEG